MSAKKRKGDKPDQKTEISPETTTSSTPASSSSPSSPPEQLLDKDAPEQADELDEDTVIANYAIEMAMHYYVSRLLRPLFPLITEIFRGNPPSEQEIIDVMKRNVGERSLRDQIKIMLPNGADTLSLTRPE